MRRNRIAIAAGSLAALALAGCAGTERPGGSSEAMPASDECGAQALQGYLGAVATGSVEARIREAAGEGRVRVIGPDDVVTMDFRPDRLNVETDAEGRIVRIRCG
ncbi:I78 family peptidase inhibitor [Novosphingobium aquimarinum]|uniref:I78 family peptidase inhibitor n=1 Tax=Novosphingobium aquimarinum TaxID=2682494 RepID=UPI0012EC55C0|nr:I78 family peptidase inhibitor [Novosphingobium aquimarinum]